MNNVSDSVDNMNSTLEPKLETNDDARTCFILRDDADVIFSHKMSMFLIATCVVLGITGNSLSIMVFSSKAMRMVSSSTYLLMLAVSDSMYLVSVFCTHVLKYLRCFFFTESFIDIANRSVVLCKLLQFTLDTCSDYSSILILAFTVERMVAVYFPHRFKDICTVTKTRIVCAVSLALIAVLTGPYHFIFMGKYTDANGTQIDYCTVTGSVEEFTIVYITEYSILRVVPAVTIAVLNVFIIVKTTGFARAHRKGGEYRGIKKKAKAHDKTVQMTIMLIVVSSTYLVVYLPMAVHFVLSFLNRSGVTSLSRHALLIVGNYTKTLYVSGFSANFLLYTISGRVFREQLKLILCNSK